MGNENFPDEPLGPLAEASATMQELFNSLRVARFTEPQALYIIAYIMADLVKAAGQQNEV
jgi:hypothetical protein